MLFLGVVLIGLFIQCRTFNLFGSGKDKEPPIDAENYGVDFSSPIHHYLDKKRAPVAYDRYQKFMQGCYDKYSKRECDVTEQVRINMNYEQPSTHHNYTEMGFKKMKLPDHIWIPIKEFYENNKHKEKLERWPRGNTYVNHWDSPSYMISLEDSSLRGSLQLKSFIWKEVQPLMEEWVGRPVQPTSLYGIRVYHDRAILSTR